MSGKIFDLTSGFDDYIDEQEGYCSRLERFLNELDHPDPATMVKWLEAAYRQGAHDMAQDTLSALQDYGTFCAGVEENQYSLSDCFDKSFDNLMVYYTQVFDRKDEVPNADWATGGNPMKDE